MSGNNEDVPGIVDTTIHADQDAPTAEAPVTEQATEGVETPVKEEPSPEEPKRAPWWEKRIAESAFEAREAKRQLAAANERIAQIERPTTQPQPARNTVPMAEVEQRAAALVEERRFVDTCNEIYEAGAAKHGRDFDDAARTFGLLGAMPPAFLEGIAALGKDDGAKVYYDLGKNPDEAARIMQLPPVRMAMELSRMAAVPVKLAAVSKAPAPIAPISAGNVQSGAEPNEVTDPVAWRAWFREKRKR